MSEYFSCVDKHWLMDILTARYLCPEGNFDKKELEFPLLAAKIPRGHCSVPVVKNIRHSGPMKDDLDAFFGLRLLWLMSMA